MSEIASEPVAEPIAPAEPAEPVSPIEPTVPAAEPAWAPPQDEWQQLVETNRWLAEQVTASQQAAQVPADDAEALISAAQAALDAGDARTFLAIQTHLAQKAAQEVYAPLQPTLQAARDAQNETQVRGWLTELNVPETDQETVVRLAHGFVPESSDPRAATATAVEALKARDARIAQAAVEAYKAELTAISGARSEPGGGLTTGVETGAPVTSLLEAGRRFAARQAASR